MILTQDVLIHSVKVTFHIWYKINFPQMAEGTVDRLAELRHIQGIVGHQAERERELHGENGTEQQAASADEHAALPDTMEMGAFFAQVREGEALLDEIEKLTDECEQCSKRLLDATSEETVRSDEAMLNRLVDSIGQAGTRCRGIIQRMQQRTAALAADAPEGSGDVRMRRSKAAAMTQRFSRLMDRFQRVQAANRREHRALVERQYRVMRPEAGAEEVAALTDAVGQMTLTTQQIFALGTRGVDPRQALADMRRRRDDVMAIEQGIENLRRLFVDMENLLEAQGEQLDSLEKQVERTLEYTETARAELRRARETQRNIRRLCCVIV